MVFHNYSEIKKYVKQIRKEELARFLKNAKAEEAEKLKKWSFADAENFKYPVLQLKAACKRGDAESLTEMLHELFNLEKTEEKKH